MNTKQLIENLIREWWQRPLPKIIPRQLNLEEYINLSVNKIVSVIGFRRSGKTYTLLDLAKKVGKEKCVYINFEDERLPRKTSTLTLLSDLLIEISGKKPHILLLDEIQNMPSWSLWARRINEAGQHKLIISGSSSKLSSAELPTELRGRSLSVHVHPLSFKEFIRFKGESAKNLPRSQLLHLLREYLMFGGFPEIVLTEEGKRPLLLDEYYQTFVVRDIIERYNLRKSPTLSTLIQLLLNSPFITVSKLTKSLKGLDENISKTTVMRYLEFLKQSFFVKFLQLHTSSVRNRLKAERKPYFVDSYFISRYASAFSQNLGRLMENAVANRLIKLTEEDQRLNVYYWKDYQRHEADFILRRQEAIIRLIQVCFVSDGEPLPEREIKSLVKAAGKLNCQNLLLLTWDKETTIKTAGLTIQCQPLYRWLLGLTESNTR